MLAQVKSSIVLAVVWVACVAGLIALHFMVVAPLKQDLDVRQEKVAAKVDRFNYLRNAQTEQAQKRAAAELEVLDERCGDYVFDSNGLNELDFAIQSIAEENGLTDFAARRLPRTGTPTGSKLKRIDMQELTVSFMGDFPGFLRFLNRLERNRPICIVDQFTVKTSQSPEQKPESEIRLTVLYEQEAQ